MQIGKMARGCPSSPYRVPSMHVLRFQGKSKDPAAAIETPETPTRSWWQIPQGIHPLTRFKNGITSTFELFKFQTHDPKKNLIRTLLNTLVSASLLALTTGAFAPMAIPFTLAMALGWQMLFTFYNGIKTPPDHFRAQRETTERDPAEQAQAA